MADTVTARTKAELKVEIDRCTRQIAALQQEQKGIKLAINDWMRERSLIELEMEKAAK